MEMKKRQEDEERSTLSELPDDIMVEILAKIPPKFLYKTFRCVYKSWYRLISSSEFMNKTAIHHNPGIFIQSVRYFRSTTNTSFLQMDGLNFNLTNLGSSMGIIRSSCNGLVLVYEPISKEVNSLCVKNLLTGPTSLTLPNCLSGCTHKHGYHGRAPGRILHTYCGSALGFDPLTKVYKVVHINNDGYGIEVFTIGSDKTWRKVPLPWPVEKPRRGDLDKFEDMKFFWRDPVSIKGQVFHWFVDSEKYIFSMDISNEKVSKTKLPYIGKTIMKEHYDLVAKDEKLAFVYKGSESKIDVWVLNDFGRQVWSMEHSIVANWEAEKKLPQFMKLVAVASWRNGEVIMFKAIENFVWDHHDFIYLYDTKSKEMKEFKMKLQYVTKFIPHRSSLVSWRTEMD
ncbi:putative F-box protein At3g25460 [Gossypium raimondii]|uniref:F-box domain-containing protein n=1 Tax=Gossypium raimondii TaxID=29730 RepID=A0A0D2U537_GOSRA|nr:putative F-box protein At3g25460 [Gossypium raimondii]KJB63091.1 hypothetical protein B456_009G452600 [Gossypium raimondii]